MFLRNIYFNITGPDGVGKDSVIEKILETIDGYVIFREPGGTKEAEVIREILLCLDDYERKQHFQRVLSMNLLPLTKEYVEKAYHIFNSLDQLTDNQEQVGAMEMYLYAASRNESNNRLVLPSLKEGKAVIGSRSVACSMAYQGNARGLGYEKVWETNKPALTRLPDFEIFLDLDTEITLERLRGRKEKSDRLDKENEDFHRKSREGYLAFYDSYCPYPVFKVDASGTIEENAERVLEVIKQQYKKSL